MKIITYYTTDTPYEEQVKILVESLTKIGEEIELCPRESRGDWVANCSMKPSVILEAMNDKESVLWLDADSEILAPLDYFRELEKSGKVDVACAKRNSSKILVLTSNTVWVSTSKKARKFVQKWEDQCRRNPKERDGDILQSLVKKMIKKDGLRWKGIDNEFNFIISHNSEKDWRSKISDRTVIVQHQKGKYFRKSQIER